ncbi:hypothetical protein BH11MYX2_BH11MYX2_21670 [soil metagenome]
MSVPAYEQELSAFHEAFAVELEQALALLPLLPTSRALDLACGDGFYTRRLAERLGAGGTVVGADIDPDYLEVARKECASYRGPATIELVEASFEHLPFPAHSFDLIWCAQSLQSLPDPVTVLEKIAPFVRPGGAIGILENDVMHQVFLPWPADLEIALRAAELRAIAAKDTPSKFYIGRRLASVFARAGLTPVSTTTISIDRQAPFADAERALLQHYLDALVERVTPELDACVLERLRAMVDEQSPDHLLRQPHLTMTWVNVLAIARTA